MGPQLILGGLDHSQDNTHINMVLCVVLFTSVIWKDGTVRVKSQIGGNDLELSIIMTLQICSLDLMHGKTSPRDI